MRGNMFVIWNTDVGRALRYIVRYSRYQYEGHGRSWRSCDNPFMRQHGKSCNSYCLGDKYLLLERKIIEPI